MVRRQIATGASAACPWGISESAYNVRDLDLTYQYSNFGVPGLGLERGLGEDLVVAPYATALAAMVDPAAAVENFARWPRARGGAAPTASTRRSTTRARARARKEPVAIVRAYMAHHQGMTLVALANVLERRAMRAALPRRADRPGDRAAAAGAHAARRGGGAPRAEEVRRGARARAQSADRCAVPARRTTPMPRTHLLSNGRYAGDADGRGLRLQPLARPRGHALARGRDARLLGHVRLPARPQSGAVWSAGYQPTGVEPDSYEVTFFEDRAEFMRRDGSITTTLEVVVSPEDDAEIRRVSVTNLGTRAREIELTSYAELVLAPRRPDAAHPAFSNLFVQTEFVADLGRCWRRAAAVAEDEPGSGRRTSPWSRATLGRRPVRDRPRALPRPRPRRGPDADVGRRRPAAVEHRRAVLDPIFSLRRRVRLAAGSDARRLLDARRAVARARCSTSPTSTATRRRSSARHAGLDAGAGPAPPPRRRPDEAHLFQRLANRVLYSDPSLRPAPAGAGAQRRGPSALWAHGISGDLPIVLVRIDDAEDRHRPPAPARPRVLARSGSRSIS